MPNFIILVVEDEEAIREMLVVVLEQAGFTVSAVSNAEEGQRFLNDTLPDLILLDWMLPSISGIEWARRLRKEPVINCAW
jgi:two-component system phosphate regulon response regulator PhoB